MTAAGVTAAAPAPARPVGLVIFDCDGVLVDSEAIANRLFAGHLQQAGFPLSEAEALAELRGLSMAACLDHLQRRFGRPLPEGFVAALQEATFAAFAAELKPVEGVAAALDRIACPVCVASSGEPAKLRLTLGLTGLLPRFEGRLFSAIEVPRGKPFPDLFLHAAARMGVAPTRCVVVEDAVPGVQAARAAGMRVLGYAGAPHADRAGLAAAGAEVFDEMARLPELLGAEVAQ